MTDLTKTQKDYAIFLPAISGAYAGFIGNQRNNPTYVPQSRMPAGMKDMEMLNFFNSTKGLFKYKYGLYSAGHANLDLTKYVPAEDMLRNKEKDIILLGDSGGYQIGTGKWKANWADPNCPDALKYRETSFKWLSGIAEYSMSLDVPDWLLANPDARANTNIHTYADAKKGTQINNDYFIANNKGETKFLNVIQGQDHTTSDDWYNTMKHYNDHSLHEYPFKGWSLSGSGAADYHLLLKRVINFIHDGLLKEGENDWLHILGIGKMTHGVVLTAIQRAVRKYHNPNFTISFDAASPFLTTANGGIYTQVKTPCNNFQNKYRDGGWGYQTERTLDDKNLWQDTRPFIQAAIQDGLNKQIFSSPVLDKLLVKDVCVYGPNCLNKIGKQGVTAWDTFTYALFMAHNVYTHIYSIQEANRQYDNGCIPAMLIDQRNATTITDIVEELFTEKDINKQYDILNKYSKFFMNIKGNRGFGGKNSIKPATSFKNLFDEI